jgi:hypothetical protein
MSAIYDKDPHSRGSSKTEIPDLERGEAKPEKEEEVIADEEVRLSDLAFDSFN